MEFKFAAGKMFLLLISLKTGQWLTISLCQLQWKHIYSPSFHFIKNKLNVMFASLSVQLYSAGWIKLLNSRNANVEVLPSILRKEQQPRREKELLCSFVQVSQFNLA